MANSVLRLWIVRAAGLLVACCVAVGCAPRSRAASVTIGIQAGYEEEGRP